MILKIITGIFMVIDILLTGVLGVFIYVIAKKKNVTIGNDVFSLKVTYKEDHK